MHYRPLSPHECSRISEIDRSEYIERVWRMTDGEWQLKHLGWQEDDWPGGVETYIRALESTLKAGGAVFGAFDADGTLAGVASLNRDPFGTTARYLLLDNMFVSRQHRGKGIGKHLTQLCADQARAWGAERLYTCAASSEATVAFYKGMGFVHAREVNEALYAEDPRDLQLEWELTR